MLVVLRPWFWALAVLGLLASPGLIAPLFDVDYHDPARCTLGPICAKLDVASTR